MKQNDIIKDNINMKTRFGNNLKSRLFSSHRYILDRFNNHL